MVEEFNPYIEQLLLNEPWRAGEGDTSSPCSGDLDWDGTPYWLCKDCGRVGQSTFTMHYPAQSPTAHTLSFFRRVMQAMTRQLSESA